MTYRAIVTREDGYWLADVPALEGAHTYAESLEKLVGYVRETVILAEDLADDASPEVELFFASDVDVQ